MPPATVSVWLFKPLAGLAAIAVEIDRPEAAARLLGTVDSLLQRTGAWLLPFDRPIYERAESAARTALGDAEFVVTSQSSGELTPADWLLEADAVVSAAREDARTNRRRGTGADSVLTAREWEVLRLLADNKTDREIAAAPFVSRRTVNAHVANILGQFGVHSRQEAVAHARQRGLLPPAPEASRYTWPPRQARRLKFPYTLPMLATCPPDTMNPQPIRPTGAVCGPGS